MSARDGAPAPAACMRGNGLRQCQNGAPRSAVQYLHLPDTASSTLPVPRRRRNAGSGPATEPRSVRPPAAGSGGMSAGRSRGPPYGPAASDWLVVRRGSAAPSVAWWHATPLPVRGAVARLPFQALNRLPPSLDWPVSGASRWNGIIGVLRAAGAHGRACGADLSGLVEVARQSPVNGMDETGWKWVGGRLQWLHVAVSGQVTVCHFAGTRIHSGSDDSGSRV